MAIYRCRFVRPDTGSWKEVEWNGDPLHAANEFHHKMTSLGAPLGYTMHDDRPGRSGIKVEFALVEIEGYGEVVSRVFHSYLYRRGGVPAKRPSTEQVVQDIAVRLGWTHDPMELLEHWDGEDTSS